jgi:hypothetical protein
MIMQILNTIVNPLPMTLPYQLTRFLTLSNLERKGKRSVLNQNPRLEKNTIWLIIKVIVARHDMVVNFRLTNIGSFYV